MSKRLTRPQPITAPAPESFLPSFDFASPQKPRAPKGLPQRKMPPLSKRLAAFAFLNLEDIVEEVDEIAVALHGHNQNVSPVSTSSKGARFWDFGKSKNHHDKFASPTTPASLPPMSSKAYATLVGGAGGSATSSNGPKPLFTPPPSKVIRSAPSIKSTSSMIPDPLAELESDQLSLSPEEKKSLAVDLVSIFSVASDDMESDKSRFSFPMPPSFVPRRGSQSPLDPDMSFTSMLSPVTLNNSPVSPDSPDSGFTEYSFFSPLFSPGFATQQAKPVVATEKLPIVIVEESISPLDKVQDDTKEKKSRPTRPSLNIPPALPPPRDSPPATPGSPTLSEKRAMAMKRICPSPDLDPEFSSVHPASASIESLLLSGTETMSESGAEDSASPKTNNLPVPLSTTLPSTVTSTGVNFGNWDIGSPSRSDSIVTITQRTFNAMRGRGSISGSFSTVHGSFSGPSLGRNGSWGSGEVYDNWEQAIDDIYLHISRRPSLASIALAASAEGAALPSTTLEVVDDAAFVMDDEMRRKLMESQFLVPTRVAPAPPSPKGSMRSDVTKSTLSLPEDDSEYVTASATSSARSSFDERRPSPVLAPVPEPRQNQNTSPTLAPAVAPLRLKRPTPANLMVSSNPEPFTPSIVKSPRPNTRPPPMQSIPSSDTDSSIFSPLSAAPFSSFTQPIDIDSWPQWTGIDATLEAKRKARRPSENGTMISKFSDDSFEVTAKRKRSGTNSSSKSANKVKKSSMKTTTTSSGSPTNLSPGSSHTSYNFLGLKKKTSSGAVANTTTTTGKAEKGSPKAIRQSFESTQSGSSGEGSKKHGLRRPPLPLELFIRA